jgi:hypothetical protein
LNTPQGQYLKWARDNEFQSMLPKDVRNRNNATKVEAQPDLHPHLKEKPKVIPYTDTIFRDAAVEWLISTDQVSENSIDTLNYQ